MHMADARARVNWFWIKWFVHGGMKLFFWPERKPDRREDADERRDVIPRRPRLEIKEREHHEHRQRDDLLDDLQLVRRVTAAAPAVGRHLQDVFKKRDAPARQDDEQQRRAFEFQMAIPRERHENVREGQQHDRQPAGLSQVIHNKAAQVWPQTGCLPIRDWCRSWFDKETRKPGSPWFHGFMVSL